MAASIAVPPTEFTAPLSFDFPHQHLLPSDTEISVGWHDEEHITSSSSSSSSSSPPHLEVASPPLPLHAGPSSSPNTPQLSRSITGSDSDSSSPNTASRRGSSSDDPTRQLALLIRSHSQGWARSFELHRDWPRPSTLAGDEVLVRNVCMGLNPVDFKSLLYRFGIESFPCVLGRDIYGVVEEVGSDVQHQFRKGDRVWTCADSRDPARAGAYQSWSVAKAFTLGKLPTSDTGAVSDEEAATIGTGLVTAGVALHWFFDLPRATELGGGLLHRSSARPQDATQSAKSDSKTREQWLLVYGGGAVTGLYAAQLAHLSGLKVLSVASPENFEYLKSIGVDVCIDRYQSSEEILNEIAHATSGADLAFAIDCVGSATATLCQRALSRPTNDPSEEPARLICLAGNPKRSRDDVDQNAHDNEEEARRTGKEASEHTKPPPQRRREVQTPRISFSTTFYSDVAWSTDFLHCVEKLLTSASLKTVRPVVLPDGLAGVRRGLESLRDGTAPRAKKLVVRLEDTPDADVTNLGQKEELGWNGCV